MRRWRLALSGIVFALLIAYGFRDALLRGAIGLAAATQGYAVHYDALALSSSSAQVRGLRVGFGGGTLLEAARVAVRFSLGELVHPVEHRYGLIRLDLDRPIFRIERKADGSWNLPEAGGAGGGAQAAPLNVDGTVRGGWIVLEDADHGPEHRAAALRGIDGSYAVDTAASSRFAFTGTIEGGGAVRLSGFARANNAPPQATANAVSRVHLKAAAVPLARLLSVFVNSDSLAFESGTAREVDAYLYAHRDGPFHLTGSGNVDDLGLRIKAILAPVRLSGEVALIDGGLAASALHGTAGPVTLQGSALIYGLPAEGRLAVGALARTPLQIGKGLFEFARRLPIAGDAALRLSVTGSLGDPIVLAALDAANPRYAGRPFGPLEARAGYFHDEMDFIHAGVSFQGVRLVAAGGLDTTGDHAAVSLALSASGDAGAVPYLDHLVGPGTVFAEAAGTGPGDSFTGTALLSARGEDRSVAIAPGTFTLRGAVAMPFAARQPGGGSVVGRFTRSAGGELALWADARSYRLEGSRAVELGDSGRIAGVLDGRAALAGPPSSPAIVGRATLTQAQLGTLKLDRVSADAVPARGGSRFPQIAGSGPFGRFAGSGALAGTQLALQGRYTGSFEQLRALTGDLGGAGPLSGPVSIVLDRSRVVIQTGGVDAAGATIRGVPLSELAGTIALAGKQLTVTAAQARFAGGSAVAAGTSGRVGFVATGLDAAQLRAAGLPLAAGSLSLAGTASAVSAGGESFRGSAVLRNGRYRGLPVQGAVSLDLAGSRASFSAGGTVAGADAKAHGSLRLTDPPGTRGSGVGGLTVAATTLGLPLAGLATVGLRVPKHLAGGIDLDLRVDGTPAQPGVAGNIAIPVGSYGLLPFTAASARLRAAGGSAVLSEGGVDFGPDRVSFTGSADRAGGLRAGIRAPQLDLINLDPYFYRAGTLAGRGSANLALERAGGLLRATGDLEFHDLVILRPAGDASARLRMQNGVIVGSGALSAQGNFVHADVRVFPVAGAPVENPLKDALVSATIRAQDANLMRDAGLLVPPSFPSVSGSLSASGVLEGRLPNLALTGTGQIRAGAVGRFPFSLASLSLHADRAGATITDARVYAGGSSAIGSGYVGFAEPHRVEARVALDSPQVHDLLAALTNRPPPFSGSLQATAKVTGTLRRPSTEGAFFLPGGAYDGVAISRAVGSFAVTGRDFSLRDTTIAFSRGRVILAGELPIETTPFAIGPPAAPIGFDFTADALDLANFKPILPSGSKLEGVVSGAIGVSGTVGRPTLLGSLALSGGTLAAPFLTDPLTAISASVALSGNQVQLTSLRAKAGTGTLEAAATVAVEDGALAAAARVRAQRAVLGSPEIGRGTIDADLAFDRAPHMPGSLSGSMSLSDAAIPFSALYAPVATGGPSKLPHLLLDVQATVGKNVRVRSGNVDIAGSGSMHLTGTLDDPRLDGSLDAAPGGTIVFGSRAFRLQDGKVSFTPTAGLDPTLAATATISVPNSDPDTARNPTGFASVALQVTGTLSNPSVVLSSTPSYSSEQILGLLLGAQAFGASLFTAPGTPSTPSTASTNAGNQLGQQALGVVSAQFTRLLLAPFETSLSGALGLTSIDFDLGGASAVGVSARKLLNKDIFAIYSSSFIYPYRQSFGLELRARRYTSAQLTYYTSLSTANPYYIPVTSPFLNQGSIGAYALNQTGDTGITFSIRQYYPPP